MQYFQHPSSQYEKIFKKKKKKWNSISVSWSKKWFSTDYPFKLRKMPVTSPISLVWKFYGKAQFPHCFGRLAPNSGETVPSTKFPHQEIGKNYCILRSASIHPKFPNKLTFLTLWYAHAYEYQQEKNVD